MKVSFKGYINLPAKKNLDIILHWAITYVSTVVKLKQKELAGTFLKSACLRKANKAFTFPNLLC